jgi:hypothetical protein
VIQNDDLFFEFTPEPGDVLLGARVSFYLKKKIFLGEVMFESDKKSKSGERRFEILCDGLDIRKEILSDVQNFEYDCLNDGVGSLVANPSSGSHAREPNSNKQIVVRLYGFTSTIAVHLRAFWSFLERFGTRIGHFEFVSPYF